MAEEKNKLAPLDLRSVELDDLLGLFIGVLTEKAWQYMGVRLVPGKSVVEKDMVKAKSAIDCVSFLTDRLVTDLSPDDARVLRSMLADLQLNFVKQS